MKKLTFFFLLITISSLATTIPLNQTDSVRFNFLTSKTCYGNSATLEVNGKKFKIGVFDLTHKGNDSIKKYGFIAIYKLDDSDLSSLEVRRRKQATFFEKFDRENFLALYNLKYLMLEGEQYELSDVNLNSININKLSALNKDLLTNDNHLDCLYDLHYFNEKFTDSLDQSVSFDGLFKPQALNVIYFTLKHCPPCEKIKYDMAELATSSNIQLNIIMEEGGRFDEVFSTLKQKFFYNRKLVKNNLGYPTVLLFDGKGIFIKTINHPSEDIIKTIYNYAEKIK